VLYLGNNDGFGSHVSDRRLLDTTQAGKSIFSRVENWFVDYSGMYVFLKALARYINQVAFGVSLSANALGSPRVPLDQFDENIKAMVRWAESTGVDVYIIVSPTPLEYPPSILEYD